MALAKEQIWETADRLSEQGRKPTLVALREAVGGSYSTLAPALREWKARQAQRPEAAGPLADGRGAQAGTPRPTRPGVAACHPAGRLTPVGQGAGAHPRQAEDFQPGPGACPLSTAPTAGSPPGPRPVRAGQSSPQVLAWPPHPPVRGTRPQCLLGIALADSQVTAPIAVCADRHCRNKPSMPPTELPSPARHLVALHHPSIPIDRFRHRLSSPTLNAYTPTSLGEVHLDALSENPGPSLIANPGME